MGEGSEPADDIKDRGARSERGRRLAEALRLNLRRRKAQQRERSMPPGPAAPLDGNGESG